MTYEPFARKSRLFLIQIAYTKRKHTILKLPTPLQTLLRRNSRGDFETEPGVYYTPTDTRTRFAHIRTTMRNR